jgi:hypothetical protein
MGYALSPPIGDLFKQSKSFFKPRNKLRREVYLGFIEDVLAIEVVAENEDSLNHFVLVPTIDFVLDCTQ